MKLKSKLGIVGAGPCGLTLGLLLNSSGFSSFKIFERKAERDFRNAHPAAHYINARSMEVFSEVKGLEDKIRSVSEDLNQYPCYRYVREIGGVTFQVTDQLNSDVLARLKKYTDRMPVHIPQTRLVNLLADEYTSTGIRDKIQFDASVTKISQFDDKVNIYKQVQVEIGSSGQASETQEFEWLVLSDGLRSRLRSQTNIILEGKEDQFILNVHFVSKKLASALRATNQQAMLHFVFNNQIIGVLVNHSYKEGVFVAQIPVFPKMQDVESLLEPTDKSQVMAFLSRNLQINESDIEIKGKGLWKVSSQLANSYIDKRVVLVGDSAHSVPPSGGLGMNTGIMDAFFLYKTIKTELSQASLKDYSDKRRADVKRTLVCANKLYDNVLEISKTLGLSMDVQRRVESGISLANSVKLRSFLSGMVTKIGTMHLGSDLVCQGLAAELRKRNIQVPLILPEIEFQDKLSPPLDKNIEEVTRQDCIIIKLKSDTITIYESDADTNGKKRAIKELFDEMKEEGLRIELISHIQDSKATPLLQLMKGWNNSNKRDEIKLFVRKSELESLSRFKLPKLVYTGTYIRRDGCIEVGSS